MVLTCRQALIVFTISSFWFHQVEPNVT